MQIAIPISLILIGLGGCADIAPQDIADPPAGKDGDLITWSDSKIGECPRIEGAYWNNYELNGLNMNSRSNEEQSDVLLQNFVGRFEVNDIEVAEESFPSRQESLTALTHDSFFILNQTESSFVFVRYAAPNHNKEIMINRKFDMLQGHFTCEEGFIVLPVTNFFGAYEWGSVNSKSIARIRGTEDGFFVLYEQTGPSKKTAFKGTDDIEHKFYKFEAFKR